MPLSRLRKESAGHGAGFGRRSVRRGNPPGRANAGGGAYHAVRHEELTGVSITQSALTQDALRRVKGEAGFQYRHLREGIRESPFVHTGDTGWRMCGQPAFLMGFETGQAAVYQIRPRHRNEEGEGGDSEAPTPE